MTLKLNGSTAGSVSIDAPADTSPTGTDVTLTLPTSAGSSGEVLTTNGSGTLSWGPNVPDAIDVNASAPADSVNINSSGQLLVGTTTSRGTATPGMLQIAGGNGSSTFSKVAIISGNNEDAGGMLLSSSASNSIQIEADPDNLRNSTLINFQIDGTERMRITNAGFSKFSNNGTYRQPTSSEHEFSNHTSNNWVLRLNNHHSSDPYGFLIEYNNSAPNDGVHYFIYAGDNSAVRFQVKSNGGINNYQSNNTNLCDEREKKNIVDLDSTWDCLKNWELKKFHYNEDADTDDKRYGVIAQQVAQHCPEVITDWVKQRAEDAVLDEDGNVVTPAVEEVTRMGVKEQQMYWMAIKALQEAQTRIETLETANASLEARLTALEGGAA